MASGPVPFLDYVRAPYSAAAAAQAPAGYATVRQPGGTALVWPVAATAESGRLRRLGTVPVFGPVVPCDAAVLGGRWKQVAPVLAEDGEPVAWVCRAADGRIYLPFDPNATIAACWSESYRAAEGGRAALRTARSAYYRLRPLMPRPVQLGMRRAFSRVQGARSFPAWPAETGLHDLFDLLFSLLAELGGAPVPALAPWPEDFRFALVLTHDVETAAGYASIGVLREVEESLGLRSSWNLVPKRYAIDDEVVGELGRAGFEVGVHGLYHDGRDFESYETFSERLPEMQAWGRRLGAVGFRSPATHRVWEWMPELGFDYDSSYSDSAPYEPEPGGSCSWLPYLNQEQVELPITLVQDHTLFEILRGDGRLWIEKAEIVRERGGMVLCLTHPDYMLDPARIGAYRGLLARYADDPSCWHALPRDVAAWWRERDRSELVPDGDGWAVAGPASSRARVEMLGEPGALERIAGGSA
jgi:hypothetical protein